MRLLCQREYTTFPLSTIRGELHTKLRSRSLDFGILVAMNGITGDADDLSEAHEIAAYFLQQGVRLVVLTRVDHEQFTTGRALVKLIQKKLLRLTVGYRLD